MVEQFPKLEGRQMVMLLAPKKCRCKASRSTSNCNRNNNEAGSRYQSFSARESTAEGSK